MTSPEAQTPVLDLRYSDDERFQILMALYDNAEAAYLAARREVFDLCADPDHLDRSELDLRQISLLERMEAAEAALKAFRYPACPDRP